MRKLEELIRNTRTCRRFYQDTQISQESLKELVGLAGLGGSARNAQPLKYMLVNDPETNNAIFPNLLWAGYLPEWPGPEEGERPAAYILCLLDTRISQEAECDLGIATQNILLGATAKGLGGCRIGSISPRLRDILKIPDHLKILLVVALGLPKEEVRLEKTGPDGTIKYWRDENQVHHVPKRSLDEIIVKHEAHEEKK